RDTTNATMRIPWLIRILRALQQAFPQLLTVAPMTASGRLGGAVCVVLARACEELNHRSSETRGEDDHDINPLASVKSRRESIGLDCAACSVLRRMLGAPAK